MLLVRSQQQADRDYFYLGRRILHYYDNAQAYTHMVEEKGKDRKILKAEREKFSRLIDNRHLKIRGDNGETSGFTVAINHQKEQLRWPWLAASIPVAATNIAFIALLATTPLSTVMSLGGILALVGVFNTAWVIGKIRHTQLRKTIIDIRDDYNLKGETTVRHNVKTIEKKLISEPPHPITSRIEKLAAALGMSRRPGSATGKAVTITPLEPELAQELEHPKPKESVLGAHAEQAPTPSAPESSRLPETPQASFEQDPEPLAPSAVRARFLKIATWLEGSVQHTCQTFKRSEPEALEAVHRTWRPLYKYKPGALVSAAFSKLARKPHVSDVALFDMAASYYRDSLKVPGHPSFTSIIGHFRQKSAQPD